LELRIVHILVTGATGSVGRLVVDELVHSRASVRALTVDPQRAKLPESVDVVRGNIYRPETLSGVFDGITKMYLAPATEVAADICALARDAGVEHIVDLSGEPESWWGPIVTAVEDSGVEWTHLWAGEFMENSTIWADQIRSTRQVRDAFPTAANAPIAMADIAAVAAKALLGDGHTGRTYSLTGPETLTRADLVRQIGDALGTKVPFIEVSRDEAIAQLTPSMGEYATWYVDGAASLVDNPQLATTTLADVLGGPATTFAEWATVHVGEFR
jgi:uncharacterized protein YbjT (DUF2867 family)